jgi:hypothetical protein
LKKTIVKKVLAGTLPLALLMSSGVLPTSSAHAASSNLQVGNILNIGGSVTGNVYTDKTEQNSLGFQDGLFDGESVKRQPLVQAVTPAIGATKVRPDQVVEVQLNTNAIGYNLISKFASRYLSAYVLDGKNIVAVDKSSIKFDAVTGKVYVQHAVLDRHTQYAVVIGVSSDGINQSIWQDALVKSLDVITAVDKTAKTVTLLGHGTVPIDFGKWSNSSTYVDRVFAEFEVGDVVSANVNKHTGKTEILQRKDMGASTIFTTGSAVGELTSATASVANATASVLDGGSLNVTATDDYGTPATNATVTITGTGTGNSRVPSAFVPQTAQITNGTVDVPLVDHSAETVNISYIIQDSVNHDPENTKSGSATQVFTAGKTDKLTVVKLDKVIVGKSYAVTGEALDAYGNGVQDGTQVGATPVAGKADTQASAVRGNFSINYTAPTKVGAESLTIKASDADVVTTSAFDVAPDVTATLQFTAPEKAIVGTMSTISGTAVDQYGNTVADGTEVFVVATYGTIANVTNTLGGYYSFDYTAGTKAGSEALTVTAKDSGVAKTANVSLIPDVTATIRVTAPSTLVVGKNSAFTGTAVDKYGNNVVDGTGVSASATNGTIANVAPSVGGTFSFAYTAATKAGTDAVTVTAKDSGVVGSTYLTIKPDVTATLKFTAPANVVVGTKSTIAGTAVDQYGNNVTDGTGLSVLANSGSVSNTSVTLGGKYSFDYTGATKSGAVALTVTAKDSGVSQSATVVVKPDFTATLQLTAPAKVVVGTKSTITGNAVDKYGNNVADGTKVSVSANNGVVADVTVINGGKYSFDYTASTKAGNDALVVTAKDSNVYKSVSVGLMHDRAVKSTISLPSQLQSGKTASVTGSVVDQYNNGIDASTFSLTGALTGSLTTDANGNYSGNVNVVSSGSVAAQVNGSPVALFGTNGVAITSITTQSALPQVRVSGTTIQYSKDGGVNWTSVTINGTVTGVVLDPTTNTYWATVNRGTVYYPYTYQPGGWIYSSKDAINWYTMTDNFNDVGWVHAHPHWSTPTNSIATDGKGTLVIGIGNHNSYSTQTELDTATGDDRLVNWFPTEYEVRTNSNGAISGAKPANYVGVITKVEWDGTQFVATGELGKLYSATGANYSWHR